MARATRLFESETPMMRQDAVAFLHELADKLNSGRVTLRQGAESVTLEVPTSLILEIKAEEAPKRQGLKRTFEIELEWVEGETAVSGPVTLG